MPNTTNRRPTAKDPSIHYNRIEFLSLRSRRKKIDRISAAVKKPKRVIPLNAPNGWRQLPLTIKIPMLKFSKGMLTFTRQKVGHNIFNSNVTDFDLSDPYCKDVEYNYEPLHDLNMKNFTCKMENLKLFQQRGLIDANNEVLCTLKQFNNYRRYLKRQVCNEMRRIGAVEDEQTKDRINYHRIVDKMKTHYVQCNRKVRTKKCIEKIQATNEKRMERLQLAQEKYVKQLENHEAAKNRKRLDVEMESIWRQKLNDTRRDDIAEAQKLRAIMLKRKFAATEENLRQRQTDQRKTAADQRKQQIANSFAAKMEWRDQKHIHDTHLIQLNGEISKYSRMINNRKIDAVRNKMKCGIVAKRAALIRDRYAKRTVNEICDALMRCIQNYDETQILIDLNKNADDDIQPWDVISLCSMVSLPHRKSTYASFEEICDIDDKHSAINKSESQDLFSDIDEMSTDYMAGVSKRLVPYEPAALRYKGLIEPQYGINSLTNDNVRQAVNASYQKFIDLQIPQTTINILFESMKFLRRIANGFTTALPKDNAVLEFVRKNVSDIYENIIQLNVKMLSNKSTGIFSNHQFCCWSTGKKRKSHNQLLHPVRFDDNVQIIEASTNDDDDDDDSVNYKSTMKCGREKFPTLNVLAKSVFNTPDLLDLPELPDDMHAKSLAHLYKHQKYLIMENLNRLDEHLAIKVIYLSAMKYKSNEIKNFETIINYGIESVLMLPEMDMKFGYHVTEIAKKICYEIKEKIVSV